MWDALRRAPVTNHSGESHRPLDHPELAELAVDEELVHFIASDADTKNRPFSCVTPMTLF